MSQPVRNLEQRIFPFAFEQIRAKASDAPRLAGYAAVFDAYSEDMGFRERIAPGAFSDALARSDVRALWNHDPNYVLGRRKSGTLSLREDERGLYMENTPPDTQWARDLLVTIERGDVDQMSIGFTIAKERWAKVGAESVRTLLEIDQLFDVSPVTYSAYPDTIVATRSLEQWQASEAPATLDLDLRARKLRLAMSR